MILSASLPKWASQELQQLFQRQCCGSSRDCLQVLLGCISFIAALGFAFVVWDMCVLRFSSWDSINVSRFGDFVEEPLLSLRKENPDFERGRA